MAVEPPTGQRTDPQRKPGLPPQESLAGNSSKEVGAVRPSPCWNVESRDPCAGLAQASPAAVSSLVGQSHHFQKTVFTPVPTSGSYSFPILSSLMVSELCGNVRHTDVPNVAGNSIDSYSLYFDQKRWQAHGVLYTSTRDLTICVLTAIYCTKRLLQ